MEALLKKGLAELRLDEGVTPSLLRFGELLLEKNKVMNLTAITEPEAVARLHSLDSAALLTLADFRGKSVVDVGTGAGFPGMPLRLLEPSLRLTLLDSLGKRITFLQGCCDALGLTDVDVLHGILHRDIRFGDRLTERIKVDADEVDLLDSVVL